MGVRRSGDTARLIERESRDAWIKPAGIASDLSDGGRQARGVIRLRVSLSFEQGHFSPLLPGFGAICSEVRCEIDFTERRVKVVEEGFDLALRIVRRLEPLDVARRIGSGRLTMLALPDYLRRRGDPRHWERA